MKKVLLLLFIILVTLFGFLLVKDDMKPEDFKNTKPVIQIEKYFAGNVKAWGVLQDRKGKVTRQFTANMSGNLKIIYLYLMRSFFGKMEKNKKEFGKLRKLIIITI